MSAITVKCSIDDRTIDLKRDSGSVAITTAAGNVDSRILSVGTSEEEHTFSADIGNAGYVYIDNQDTTNFVDVGFATGVYPIRVKAGHPQLFSITPAQGSLFLKADTAACRVEVTVREA